MLQFSDPVRADFEAERDLVALHYDHAPDRDDGHAAVSALAVVHSFNLNVDVVGGTYGRWNADRYDAESVAVMNAAWGSNWSDAHGNLDAALLTSRSRWLQTLDSGGDVWVAEGGQADFTANVLRQVHMLRPGIDTRERIHVIQHSDWNEVHADQSDLDFVRGNTQYVRIDDGNFANGTADLNQKSQSFVADALSSAYAAAWRAAFAYLDPNFKLDFSDTVELLFIVGVGTQQVDSPDAFATQFFGTGGSHATAPSSALHWTDSYAVNGQCYCDSNFDYGLDQITVATADGTKSVVEICADISNHFGAGSSSGRLYYNTVQCGHPPVNSLPAEAACPGFLTDSQGSEVNFNCNAKGASWNLDLLYTVEEAVEEIPVVGPTAAESNSSHPICQSAASDPDGDGYGWENSASCLVTFGSTPADDHTTISDSGFPTCNNVASDPDGDGYGWENNTSCIVGVNSSGGAGSNGVGNFPICRHSGSDSDGDGYGWENEQSCLVK